MQSAFSYLMRLAAPAGRIPAEIPDHYVRHARAYHRAATLQRIANRNRRA